MSRPIETRDTTQQSRNDKGNSEPVILRSDVDFVGEHVLDRLVVPAVSELELVSLAPRRTREQLVAEANAEDGDLLGNGRRPVT